ncbi:MAG: DoxX family protein [Fulvivirga sp.]|uniref:DoxX family protein n=1 Tax=Fulvivirga sp. TaxID=1931237 RepID=UPI0032EBA848
MYYLEIALKLIVSLSILNVWLLRANKSTPYRGGKANSIKEEFAVYGLPGWFVGVIGALKVGLALALIASIWFFVLEMYAALGIAFLMFGAVAMHIKVNDPIIKAFPAALFLLLSLAIYFI